MKTLAAGLAALLFVASAVRADWEEDLDRLLAITPGEERAAMIEKVVAEAPAWEEIASRIADRERPDATTGAFLRTRTSTDGVERPWVLVVPEGYDPARPTPLLVWLHGLVTRAETMSDPVDYAERLIFTKLARDRGWLLAIPMGQVDATWFDEVGTENVREIVRTVKRERNVDVAASRVGALTILVHPSMVNLSDRLIVTVNGEKLFDDFVTPDPAFLLTNHLANRDRTLLYVAEVKITVPPR